MNHFLIFMLLVGIISCADGKTTTTTTTTTGKNRGTATGSDVKKNQDASNSMSDPDSPFGSNSDSPFGSAFEDESCEEGEKLSQPCPIENGTGVIEKTCEENEYVDMGAICMVETCEADSGFTKVGNKCENTECDDSSTGFGGFGGFVDACEPKRLVITTSKSAGANLSTVFNASDLIYFKLENALEAPEMCVSLQTEIEKCAPTSANWAPLGADVFVKNDSTYTSSPWFGRYALSAGGDYKINVRLTGDLSSAVSLTGTVAAALQPIASNSTTLNGNSAANLSTNSKIYIRGERLGNVSIADGITTTTALTAVCFEVANNGFCADLANFVDLVDGVEDWVYDANFGGGVGRWTRELPANSIEAGNYKTYFLNKANGVKSAPFNSDLQ